MPSQSDPEPAPEPRSAYKVFRNISARRMDNDVYGHVKNVVDYSWFDTAINACVDKQSRRPIPLPADM